MLWELRTDLAVGMQPRPEAEPALVPLDKGSRQAEGILELPTGMSIVDRTGRLS